MFQVIIASIVVMCASLIGVVSVWKQVGTFIEKHLSVLVSCSAGIFLVIAYTLASETIEHAPSTLGAVGWILLGGIGLILMFKLVPAFHHHHDEHTDDDHTHDRLDARRILFGDALHNIGDGILLTASFLASTSLGLVTMASIFIHELVQETSEFFVLRQSGYSTKKALYVNFLVSGTILIGSIGSFFLLEQFEAFEVPLLGIAAGSFFVVVLHDLIPHSIRTSHGSKHYGRHIAWFIIGICIMAGITMATGSHGHGHESEGGGNDHAREHDIEDSHDSPDDHNIYEADEPMRI